MTLIISTVSPLAATMVGDRRLTSGGKIVDESAGKQGHWITADASVLYGYTGIARASKFSMPVWIADKLFELAPKAEYLFQGTIALLAEELTELLRSHPQIRLAPDKRTTIVFSGFMGNGDPTFAVVSNFEDLDHASIVKPVADEVVSWHARRGEREKGIGASMCHAAGAFRAIGGKGLSDLNQLMMAGRSHLALRQKSADLIKIASASEISGGTIGRKLQSAYLPPPINGEPPTPTVGFISDVPTAEISLLDKVVTYSAELRSVTRDIKIASADGSFVVLAKQPRNERCKCGSGKKFKHCHGR